MLFYANVRNILEIYRRKYLRQCFIGKGRAQRSRYLAQTDGAKNDSLGERAATVTSPINCLEGGQRTGQSVRSPNMAFKEINALNYYSKYFKKRKIYNFEIVYILQIK